MERLFRSWPTLILCGVVAFLAYSQFNEPTVQTDSGNQEHWANIVTERLLALEQREAARQMQPLPLATAAPAPLPIQERVIELPEDGTNWATVVVYSPDQAGARLKQNFDNTPQLLALRSQTNFYELPANHYWVQTHLRGTQLPIVLVQRPVSATEAKVIYKASGAGVSASGDVIAGEIAQAIEDCHPRPKPTPTPTPAPQPTPEPIPDLRPPVVVKPDEKDDNLGLMAYAAIAASALGGAYYAAKQGS